MPTFPQLFRHAIPKASAGLRSYWTRARTSIVTSIHSRQRLAPKDSWESRDGTHSYLELDERGGQGLGKVINDEQSEDSALGGVGKGRAWDLESGKDNEASGGKGNGGIKKTITVEQNLV